MLNILSRVCDNVGARGHGYLLRTMRPYEQPCAITINAMLPKSIKNLIEEFSKLPGVGPQSAQRLAMHLLRTPDARVRGLADAVGDLKAGIVFCEKCWNISDQSPCPICESEHRDQGKVCVVEEVLDAAAIEKTGEYDGVYHVLHGVLSPVDGVGVDELKIRDLVKRVREGAEAGKGDSGNDDGGARDSVGDDASDPAQIREIILATNPSLEGEATALYIQRALGEYDVEVSRIARGLPTGGHIEYSDDITLSRAMKGRGSF